MKYYCGIDGGGTKTAFLLTDMYGKKCAGMELEGSSYQSTGIAKAVQIYEKGLSESLKMAGIGWSDLHGIVIGVPCYGENAGADEEIRRMAGNSFREVPFYLCNDAEVGWAGSLALAPGINIVAGTGSIAFGKNSRGESVRCGGWSTFFGDEGSCYWLGRKTVELFLKQMDGRADKGELYQIIMKEFDLHRPEEFLYLADNEYAKERSRVAQLQKFLLQAADAGDNSAVKLYHDAADELGLMMTAAVKKIMLPGEHLGITLSGGLLYAKRHIIDRFTFWVEKTGCSEYVKARLTPVQGAALMAIDKYSEIPAAKAEKNMS